MRNFCLIFAAALTFLPSDLAAADNSTAAGKKAEQQSCTACHSTRLIDSQRLSHAAWTKELDKMIGWGAPASDRQLLIEYLSTEYSDSKTVPTPAVSGNGVASSQRKN